MSRADARARVRIDYCAKCRFLPRAAWLAQELLTTFAEELGEVALVPGDGGIFQVRVGDELVACRVRDGGFPELAELKRRIRDHVAPGRELGHSERA
ncbi:MAG TPA: SelT/SelW/SelH family protein [Myxococcota bacterium]